MKMERLCQVVPLGNQKVKHSTIKLKIVELDLKDLRVILNSSSII